MQLSQYNYLQYREQIDWSRMPAALTDKPKTVTDNAAAKGWADMGEQTQKATEQFFKLCNTLIAKDPTLMRGGAKTETPPPEQHSDLPFPPSSSSTTKPRRTRSPKVPKAKVVKPKLSPELPSSLPQPKQVPVIATPTAFIKRYIAMHGKVKPREGRGGILELIHGLQKAITEGRIAAAHPCSAEIGKMQSNLIKLFETMGERGKIEIDAASLAHYKEIAQGEEVRTSVRLLKQFIQMNGKSPDKGKAENLGKKLAAAYDSIPKEDLYRSELAAAAKCVAAYVKGETKIVGIPASALHGLGGIAAGGGVSGLGVLPGANGGAIIWMLKAEGVKDLSEASLKKAFRRTSAPGLCLEIAKSLIRKGALTMATVKQHAAGRAAALSGMDVQSERLSDVDILDMRLSGFHGEAVNELGSVEMQRSNTLLPRPQRTLVPVVPSSPAETVSAKDLAKMRFNTIGYSGRFKEVVGDPAVGFHMMVYGPPFNGKSSFVIELCKDLAALGKGRIAYLALEEGISLSMQKKVNDRGAGDLDGLDFKSSMPSSFDGYSFVVIDSVSDRSISRERLREMFLRNPHICFICIFHATKSGSARGGLDYSHDMDIILKIEDHKPMLEKNRFL